MVAKKFLVIQTVRIFSCFVLTRSYTFRTVSRRYCVACPLRTAYPYFKRWRFLEPGEKACLRRGSSQPVGVERMYHAFYSRFFEGEHKASAPASHRSHPSVVLFPCGIPSFRQNFYWRCLFFSLTLCLEPRVLPLRLSSFRHFGNERVLYFSNVCGRASW